MTEQWYLARDGQEYGPYSSAHVLKLAALGRLQPTDLVRKEGMANPIPAAQVKQLLPVASEDPPAAGASLQPSASQEATDAGNSTDASAAPTRDKPAAQTVADKSSAGQKPPGRPKEIVRKRRAVAISGAILMSQDGVTVKYRKKCGRCDHEDQIRSSMIIGIGVCRGSFFCPKCRRTTQIQIQGIS